MWSPVNLSDAGRAQREANHRRPSRTTILEGQSSDPGLLGGKGASLDRLVAWRLPVPRTGVVTTETYRSLVNDPGIAAAVAEIRSGREMSSSDVDEVFLAAALDTELSDEIIALGRTVGAGQHLAVRSSATVEDLERSSFAGQYRSILGVDSTDGGAVLRAVRLVFASLWYPAPCAYRRLFGIDESAASMAVVLMCMVPARRAGVVFTVDPGGHTDEARIEEVEGLADSLVSGQETPHAISVPRSGPRGTAPGPGLEALDLALQVESLAGRPQDVEWAWDGKMVWLVQARPITVLEPDAGDGFDDDPNDVADLDLTTAGIGEMLPGVLAPLVWELNSYLVEEAFRGVLDDLGVLPDSLIGRRGLIRRVRGRAAMDFSLLRAVAVALPGAGADQLEQQYFGSRRPDREAAVVGPRRHHLFRSGLHDARVLGARRRSVFDAELAIRAVAEIERARVDLGAFSDRALQSYRLRLVDLGARAMGAELAVAADAAATYRALEIALARDLGSVEAGRRAERLTTRSGISAPPSSRASAAVFAGPTWIELERATPLQIERMHSSDVDPMDELVDALEATPRWRKDSVRSRVRLRTVRRLAGDAVEQLTRRERAKAAVLSLGGEVRRVHLELGARLVGRGALETAADIDLLSPSELRGCFEGHPPPPPETIIRRRRWLLRYEADGPLPARFTGVPRPLAIDVPSGRRFEGWAASAGRVTGRAQVLHSPTEYLERDAVLVAEATDPSWSPVFTRAGAIVLERGGPLSHAAILARELGIPAVLNLPGATHVLGGRRVSVDGDSGIVVVLNGDDREDAP